MLQKFLAQTKLHADLDLINRWEEDVRFRGHADIRQQLTRAKRTAAALRKAWCELKNLSREQVLAIDIAAAEMEILARDLERFDEWAKAYSIFCEQAKKNELEEIAFERWGSDDEALQEEADLVVELYSKEGIHAFGRWVHASGWYTDVDWENISTFMGGILSIHFVDGSDATLRERMAETVKRIRNAKKDSQYVFREQPHVCCGWQKYESYLAYRKELARTTNRVLHIADQSG
jgi:hypothetical protein